MEKKAVQRIFRCPTNVKEISNRGQIITDPSGINNSGLTRRSCYADSGGELEKSLPRFGPFYGTDKQSVLAIKKKTWQHIKKSSLIKDPGATKMKFVAAIRRVEKEAKETYGGKIVGTNSEFRLMMVKDGCFFLQLALLILGKSIELGYLKNDPIFGSTLKKKDTVKWIESMFFVGNQIPLVVLQELIKEKFFQDIIANANWDDLLTSSSLCIRVLYEMLILPQRNNKGRRANALKQQPCDLLHGLHILVVGSDPSDLHKSIKYEAEDDFDLEANTVEGIHQRIFPSENGDAENYKTSGASGGRSRIFPCAMELKQAGIRIKKLKSGGIRSIHFESWYFWANLYLPDLPVDDGVEILFRNLKTYDQLTQKNHEVSSYLRLMSDIIQTGQDVKLLKERGIIQGSDHDADKLPRMLSRLSSEEMALIHEFHNLRREIRDYSSPWVLYKGILNFVVFLTVLQAFFALLAYFKPPT